ncbi:MAG: response regulator, partial [Alphaproteobacteria bacterium]|nr:response regulator [Alphaproteobacteria bacterium]
MAVYDFHDKTFVVIDDSAQSGVAQQVKMLITPARARSVHIAGDAQTAIQILQRHVKPGTGKCIVDAIVCPINMRPIDGIEFIRKLRDKPEFAAFSSIPVMLITPQGDTVARDAVADYPGVAVMEKPLVFEPVCEALNTLIGTGGELQIISTRKYQQVSKNAVEEYLTNSGMEYWKFLIIDDSDQVATSMQIKSILHISGATKIFRVQDSASALRMMERQLFHFIVMGWNSAPAGGIDFLRQIRALKETASTPSDVPVLMVCGMEQMAKIPEAKEYAFISFLKSPVAAKDMLDKVHILFGKFRDHHTAQADVEGEDTTDLAAAYYKEKQEAILRARQRGEKKDETAEAAPEQPEEEAAAGKKAEPEKKERAAPPKPAQPKPEARKSTP